jgi:hypothetical protein
LPPLAWLEGSSNGLIGAVALCGQTSLAQAPEVPIPERSAFKTNLVASQVALRDYEWIETAVFNSKGNAKSL